MADEKTSTRDKILEACRFLFNERGPAEVTTAEIAAAVGISEGNLHYHFRRKEQIVITLFDSFAAALEQVGANAEAPWRLEAHRLYLADWFNVMWEWRFFYSASVYRLAPVLRPKLKLLADRGQAHVRQTLAEMVALGKLRASPEEIDRLVVNAWIVSTYWIDYLRTRQGVDAVTRDHLQWGLAQVESLFLPHVARARPMSIVAE
jgi:AcrR family transcriptional regulator